MARVLLALLAWLVLPGAALAADDPERPRQWGLELIEADAVRAVADGTGATVAVVDSGVQLDHPDLAGRLVAGRDVVASDDVPQDGHGHGTHVLGLAGAAAANGIGIAGVAPGAAMMPVRVLGDDGTGTTRDVAAGIDWARTHRADVINLSLASDVSLAGAGDLAAAIRRALAAGVVVVAAAGNSAAPACAHPASGEGLLCVGAVDRRGRRAPFSAFGAGVALVGPGGSGADVPGEGVLSTYPPSGYAEMVGTSQAAAHVTGVAALLVGRGVRGQQAAQRLLATATDLGAPGADGEYGAGLVNARAALGAVPVAAQGGGAPAAVPRASLRLRRSLSRRRLLRAGLRLRVRATRSGLARVRATARGRTLARGDRRVTAGRASTVRAPLTRYGRRLVARRGGRLRLRVRVALPGEAREAVLRATVR